LRAKEGTSVSDFSRDLDKAARSLADAIERFNRGVTKAASTPVTRRRISRRPLPLPQAATHRPTRHPASLPVHYTRPLAPTALDRMRAREDRLRGGPNPIVAAARRTAARITNAVRRSVAAVRRGLQRIVGGARRAY
jgi:hypothetical protein